MRLFRLPVMTTFFAMAVFSLNPSVHAVPAKGRAVMIAGVSPYAVAVGKDVAQRGGNAVDVAVAAALSLSVTHPYFGALGGGGFAIVKTGSTIEALDFRETAPKAAGTTFFQGKEKRASIDGALAVGVPGFAAGLYELHKKRGKLHWSLLFPRVIELASKGFEVSGDWAEHTEENAHRFNAAAKRFFMRQGKALKPGDILKQPELAKLLKEMSVRGAVPMYQGTGARDLVDTVKAAGGVIAMEDLLAYKPRWLNPLKGEYRGYEIWSMPPPSSGGIISQSALRLMDLMKIGDVRPMSIEEYHRIGEALKLAFRSRWTLGDPAFTRNPVDKLLSAEYLADLAKLFKPDKTIDVEPLKKMPFEHDETTSLSVATGNGDAVAITITLNGTYGSGLATEKYGIMLNNEMDDFEAHPGEPNQYGLIQGQANAVEPGKRPLSSMSPTIATKNGKLALVVGSPGGPRIISTVTQVIYRTLAQQMDLDLAVQTGRVHHQFLPNTLSIDAGRFAPETLDGLRAKGHTVQSGWMSKAFAVLMTEDGTLEGAADSRSEAAAGGY